MTAANHAITGAAVGLILKQPALAIPAAFLAHFVIDALPHFKVRGEILERNRNKLFWLINLIDCGLAILLFIILPFALRPFLPAWVTAACMLVSLLPDFVWFWRALGELKTKIVKPKGKYSLFHNFIQWSETPGGIAVELIWFVSMWSLLIARS